MELCRHAGTYILWYPGLPPGVQVVLGPWGHNNLLIDVRNLDRNSIKNTFLSSWRVHHAEGTALKIQQTLTDIC